MFGSPSFFVELLGRRLRRTLVLDLVDSVFEEFDAFDGALLGKQASENESTNPDDGRDSLLHDMSP
jgi:hypothetical protein